MRTLSIELEDARALLEAARFCGMHEVGDRLQALLASNERESEDNTFWLQSSIADSEDA